MEQNTRKFPQARGRSVLRRVYNVLICNKCLSKMFKQTDISNRMTLISDCSDALYLGRSKVSSRPVIGGSAHNIRIGAGLACIVI